MTDEQDPRDERDENDQTETEALEAEALSLALERGRATDALPDDALETAAFLRYSRDAGELPREREDALLAELLQSAKQPAAQEKKRSGLRWLAWLVPMGGLAAAAAAFLIFATFSGRDAAPAPAADVMRAGTELPVPGADLVRAQLAVANGEADLDALSGPMHGYRTEMLAALDGRYGGR
jgi:hypothetical protein